MLIERVGPGAGLAGCEWSAGTITIHLSIILSQLVVEVK